MKEHGHPGNEFWKARTKHGRDKIFQTPEILWDAACEYFQWVKDNPLYEYKGFAYQGTIQTEAFPLMRAMSLMALQLFLDVSGSYWNVFKASLDKEFDADFLVVVAKIEHVIYSQKFEGASAGLLNANIIARDLGLVEKTKTEVEGSLTINIDKDDSGL